MLVNKHQDSQQNVNSNANSNPSPSPSPSYYYHFSYQWCGDNEQMLRRQQGIGENYFSVSPAKQVTKAHLEKIRTLSLGIIKHEKGLIDIDIIITSVSYLGEMTASEFLK